MRKRGIRKGLFNRHVGDVKAVDGVSFAIQRGEERLEPVEQRVEVEDDGRRPEQFDLVRKDRSFVPAAFNEVLRSLAAPTIAPQTVRIDSS